MSDPGSNGGAGGLPAEVAARLRELEEALRREQQERLRLEQVSEEVKRAVHALNNALSVITAFTAAMGEEMEADDPLRESLDEIAHAAKRAAAAARTLGEPCR
jgi:signal transduction histidine kinase